MEDVAYQSGQPIQYPDPVQGDPEVRTTRQRGLPTAQQVGFDPTPPAEIIQPGIPDLIVTRNVGPHVAGRFASDGTFHSDLRSDDNILFVDHALSDPEALPPGLERTNAPMPPRPAGFGEMAIDRQRAAIKAQAEALGLVVTDAPVEAKDSPTAFAVIASDQPGENHDPRDKSSQPQVLSALPTIKKAPVVPVVLPTPKTRHVVAKAAPKVTRAKAAANKGKK